MNAVLADFQFLRPAWLWLLLPAALLLWRLCRRRDGADGWARAVAPELLAALQLQPGRRARRSWPLWLAIGWVGAIIALAGPTWERLPQPLLQKRDALVVVLDLSLSMFATDLSPSRLQRARFKLQDLLETRTEGVTGLVVYSADAHVVAPLTDDSATIANLLPALSPDIMPQYGSNPAAGIERAVGLLTGAEATSGRILLVTDGIQPRDEKRIVELLADTSWELSILGIGTAAGGPVELGDALLRDRAGQIVVPKLDVRPLRSLAATTDGRFSELQLDTGDLRHLLPPAPAAGTADWQESDQRFDSWRERGPLLVALLLPIAALATRRGWLLLLPLVLLPLSPPAAALSWSELWRRPDQQGAALLREQQPAAAAERFADPGWRGTAHYRAGEFEAAAEAFAEVESADGLYNLGNALAQAGELEQALTAYEAALSRDPQLTDAAVNRERVAAALREQQRAQGDGDSQDADSQKDGSQDSGASEPADESGKKASDETGDGANGDTGADPAAEGDAARDRAQSGQPGEQSREPPSDGGPQSRSPEEPRQPNAEESEAASAAQGGATEDDDARDSPAAARPVEPADDASGEPADDNAMVAGEASETQPPGDAAIEQWLRRIPDDPAGLLRRKFDYESRQRSEQGVVMDREQPLW